jgi:signal transduction histidine kinase/tetratricopeptide (TPR) repeat protein
MRLVLLLMFWGCFITFSLAQTLPASLEKKDLQDVVKIVRKIKDFEKLLFAAIPEKRHKILDSLENSEKEDIFKAAVLLQKILYEAKEVSDVKILARKILFYLGKHANPCLEIYFRARIAEELGLHHENQLSYAKQELSKLKEMTTQFACTNYEIYVLYLEYKLLQKEFRNDLALAKLLEAIDFYKKNNLQEDKEQLIKIISELVSFYFKTEEYKKIVEILREMLYTLNETESIERAVINLHNSLGLAYKRINNFPEAEKSFKKAIELAEKAKDSIWIAIPKGNLAEIYVETGKFDIAEKLLEEYINYSLKYKEFGITVAGYTKMAKLHRLKKDFAKSEANLHWAEDFLNKHREAIKSNDFWHYINYYVRLYREYTEFYLATKNSEKASVYLKKYDEFRDSLTKITLNEQIVNLEARHRLKVQEQENELLKATNEKQQSQIRNNQIFQWATVTIITLLLSLVFLGYKFWKKQKEYSKSLEGLDLFKNKLFSIISHDLRNYMSSLKGYVYLINNQEMTMSELKPLSEELAKNTEYTFGLLDNVLIWAKSQMQGQTLELQTFEAKELVQKAVFEIGWFAKIKNIAINCHFQENLWVEVDFNIFLIALRNIISNAVKFSKPNGIIDIIVQKNNNYCDFIVKDYGVGIKPENLEKIRQEVSFNELGTSLEKGTGLGLMLIKSAVKDLKGQLLIESKLNEGTSVTLSLPITKNTNINTKI